MAIMGDSKVIFLDDPTSGMDLVSRKKVWNIIQTLKSEGKTILLTTHHFAEVELYSDRVAVIA